MQQRNAAVIETLQRQKTYKARRQMRWKNGKNVAANSLNKTEEHQATRGRCTWEFSPVGLSPSLKTWAGCLDENVAFWDVKWKGAFSFCGCNLLQYYGRCQAALLLTRANTLRCKSVSLIIHIIEKSHRSVCSRTQKEKKILCLPYVGEEVKDVPAEWTMGCFGLVELLKKWRNFPQLYCLFYCQHDV